MRVVELEGDRDPVAIDQLTHQAAMLRYLTGGQVRVPQPLREQLRLEFGEVGVAALIGALLEQPDVADVKSSFALETVKQTTALPVLELPGQVHGLAWGQAGLTNPLPDPSMPWQTELMVSNLIQVLGALGDAVVSDESAAGEFTGQDFANF